jgi:hypothetical protein
LPLFSPSYFCQNPAAKLSTMFRIGQSGNTFPHPFVPVEVIGNLRRNAFDNLANTLAG